MSVQDTVQINGEEALFLASMDMNCLANEESIAPSLPLLRLSLVDAVTCLPLGLVLDLAILFKLIPGEAFVDNNRKKHAGLNDYADHFLLRIQAERLFLAIHDALAGLPASSRQQGLIYLLSSILERLDYRPGFTLSLAVARRMIQRPAEELQIMHQVAIEEYPEVFAQLDRDYLAIAKAARHCMKLITSNDVLVIENISVLHGLQQRLALKQILDAAESLDLAISRRIVPQSQEIGIIATRIQTDDEYPVGGFSSITNSGKMENLVSSELIYMDGGQDIDLFDIRYSEGELLYYSRDENQFFRQQRRYTLVMHESLALAKIKSPKLPYQDLILLKAMLMCVLRRLCLWLSDYELHVQMIFLGDKKDNELRKELETSQLIYQEWTKRQILHMDILPKIEETDNNDNVILFSHGLHHVDSRALLHWDIQNHLACIYYRDEILWKADEAPDLANWVAAGEILLGKLY